ncbi:MAG TPA: NAD(P)/FAD-dependent oxidoreductase [Thermomicrobiales bacterium]|nr:NAD(P)/FAD-dependent oxidoreductase [Thermomicrobiales bacterium]
MGRRDSGIAYDAVVVGTGPNGLAAAVTLAQTGWSVLALEAASTVGGGTRSAALTLPGFTHDICSAVHPLAVLSPAFRNMPLQRHGLEWAHPPTPLAHPLDGGIAAVLERSLETTVEWLGPDGEAYRSLMQPLADDVERLVESVLGPFRIPRHPLALSRFGMSALRSASGLARSRFRTEQARALVAGIAGHSMLPLERPGTAAVALILGISAHVAGWPVARGGSQSIANALAAYLLELGGEIETNRRVTSLAELPTSRAVLFDTGPRQLVEMAGDELPGWYRAQLRRFRYGPGSFKVDWALSGAVPWTATECARAGTVHAGGTLAEISAAEAAVARGEHPERPFVLLSQPCVADPSRAPDGQHTLWGYCHVPSGSTVDMTERIEAQIERFAPGFRDLILARAAMNAVEMERYNANYIGGDINGGLQDLRQVFTRPAPRFDPYSTPNRRLYLCSSSTPPGGGVHGLCGHFAAQSVLRRLSWTGMMARTG